MLTYWPSVTAMSKGIHDVSFSRPMSRGSFGVSPLPAVDVVNHLNNSNSLDQSLNQSWIFYQYTATSSAPKIPADDTPNSPTNPNKAVVTISPRTTEVNILID